MRVTQSLNQTQFLTAISSLESNLAQTQNQISSNLSFTTASQNPTAAGAANNYNQALAQSQQYTTNANSAQTNLNTEDQALSQVQNYLYATSQKAQTTLRSIVGQFELDEILSQRDKVNGKLQIILDQDTEPWGIKVGKVEVKQVDIPEQMQRAIAKQAEAERERRAKIIHAEGEFEASQKLADAAKVLETQPTAIQLRYLQTLTEIGVEKNTTIVFPLPIDIINAWMKVAGGISK